MSAAALSVTTVTAAPRARSAVFDVSLRAQVTKTWDYRTTIEQGDCTATSHVQGRRLLTLRSARPTRVRLTVNRGRVTFSPSYVRKLVASVTRSGVVTRVEAGPNDCPRRTTRTSCPARGTLSRPIYAARFFWSGRNEVSFRPTRDFGPGGPCPPEAADVALEKPGIHQAQGELSLADLFNRRIRHQTAVATFEETTTLDGDPAGTVVARVTWSLRFTRP